MSKRILVYALLLVSCRDIKDDRTPFNLNKFTSTPPVAGEPLTFTIIAPGAADFEVKQGSKVLDWGITVRAPYTNTVTAVSDEVPTLNVWDYRLELHTAKAKIEGMAPMDEPEEPPPVVAMSPKDSFEPAATAATDGVDAGMNCSVSFDEQVNMTVQNLMKRSVQPVWIDYDCNPQWMQFRPLGPGDVFVQQTFATHVFQFYDTETEELLEEFNVPSTFGVVYAEKLEEK